MSTPEQGWALWREPNQKEVLCLAGPIKPLTFDSASQDGFWIHGFDPEPGSCIVGTSQICEGVAAFLKGRTFFPAEPSAEDEELDYKQRLADLIDDLKAGKAEKVVLSRRFPIARKPLGPAEAADLFVRVTKALPGAFICLMGTPKWGVWLTATPEVLCRVVDGRFSTMALAGTRSPANAGPWTVKEYREQSLVTDYVRERLEGLQVRSLNLNGPREVEAGRLRHLRTDFSWTGGPGLKDIADTLHPTPAVGALPLEGGLKLIGKYESSPRRLYSGYAGYVAAGGQNANLYVLLRCATLTSPQPVLWAGGGILSDSDPDSEWVETEQKLGVLQPFLTDKA